MRRCFYFTLVLVAIVRAGDLEAEELAGIDTSKLPPPANRDVDFAKDIEPILARSCYECHGGDIQEAGLRLDVKQKALAGGDSGPVILPGNSKESRLIHLVCGMDDEVGSMPPKGEREPLSKDQIALLRTWIDRGASWPDNADAGATAPKNKHWSFQPIVRPETPAVQHTSWIANPIDAFVLRR